MRRDSEVERDLGHSLAFAQFDLGLPKLPNDLLWCVAFLLIDSSRPFRVRLKGAGRIKCPAQAPPPARGESDLTRIDPLVTVKLIVVPSSQALEDAILQPVSRIEDALRGYDWFVSYAWSDGRPYAESLALALSRRFRVFLDDQALDSGAELSRELTMALRRSSSLVLVTTPAALTSRHVNKELKAFADLERPIVPIRFAEVSQLLEAHGFEEPDLDLVAARWANESDRSVARDSLSITAKFIGPDESRSPTEPPSPEVVEKLISAFSSLRRARLRQAATGFVALVLALVSVFALWQMKVANQRAQEVAEAFLTSAARDHADPLTSALLLERLPSSSSNRDATAGAYKALERGAPSRVLRGHAWPTERVEVDRSLRYVVSAAFNEAFLWRADGSLPPTTLAKGPIAGVAFHPRSGQVAVGLSGHGVLLFEPEQPDEPSRHVPITEAFDDISFSRDGRMLIVFGNSTENRRVVEGWASLISLDDAAVIARFGDHLGHIGCFAMSADGAFAVTSGTFGPTSVWDLSRPREPFLSEEDATCGAFDAKDGAVLVGHTDGRLERIDLENPEHRSTIGKHDDAIVSIAVSSDGRWVARGGFSGAVEIYSLSNDDVIPQYRRRVRSLELDGAIDELVFDDSGDWLLARSLLKTWLIGRQPGQSFELGGPRPLDVTLPPGAEWLWIAAEDGSIRQWPIERPPLDWTGKAHEGAINAIDVSTGGKAITGGQDGLAALWSIAEPAKLIRTFPHAKAIWSAAFHPDQVRFMTASVDGALRIWDPDVSDPTELPSCGKRAERIKVSNTGRYAAVSCFQEEGVLWTLTEPHVETRLTFGSIASLSFDRHDQFLAVGTHDSELVVFEPVTGDIRKLNLGNGIVWDVDVHPSGERIAAASRDNVVIVDATRLSSTTLRGHSGTVWDIAYSPDGIKLASASEDGSIRIWDAAVSADPIVLTAHTDRVNSIRYSPDGERIVSASADGTVRIWRKDGVGDPVTLRGRGRMRFAQFVDSGSRVIAASSEGTLKVWDVSWERLAPRVSALTNACLMPEDRVRYLGEEMAAAADAYATCERDAGRAVYPLPQVRPR